MRTTVDLPEDLLARARAIARATQRTVGEVIAALMRRGLSPAVVPPTALGARTGLPALSVGRMVTSDDVRAALEEP